MIINQEMAQKLVDQIMENLGYNINIMNSDGQIIASGNKERVGNYHKIAKEVIRRNETMSIYSKDIDEGDGVKPGINMPFYFRKQLAGVIGITGDPDEFANIAELVRMSSEVLLEQEYLKERMHAHQSQKSFFINRLLNMNDENLLEVKQWGTKLGYNMNLSRVACLITMHNIRELSDSNPLYSTDRIRHSILEVIKNSPLHGKEDISAFINVNEIIIFKTVGQDSHYRDQLNNYLTQISTNISNQCPLAYQIAVGTFHTDLIGLQHSYEEAKYTKHIAKSEGIHFARDFELEYMLAQIPLTHFEHAFREELRLLQTDPHLIETLVALVECHMNIKEAALHLFIHRNTLNFRLKKIRELLKIDPFNNENHRHRIWMLVTYYKLRME